ncbi:MAG: hypothetical protein NC923_01230 [Candidatus Omnitrophica bacterium]|nr:hypothetical protein [Candidatus Omnitrophota bacterium]
MDEQKAWNITRENEAAWYKARRRMETLQQRMDIDGSKTIKLLSEY